MGRALSKPTSGWCVEVPDRISIVWEVPMSWPRWEEVVSSAITHDSCTVTIPNGDWTVVKTISYMFTIPQEFHHFYGWYIYIWCFSIPQTFLVVSGIVLTTKTSKWNHFCHTEKTNKTWRCHRIKNGKKFMAVEWFRRKKTSVGAKWSCAKLPKNSFFMPIIVVIYGYMMGL